MKVRTGIGFDTHRLVDGRPCILGGVRIPHDKGLLGHSDADVLTHALMDAILGAVAAGDIGHLFPDSDPAYEGADSLVLLRKVCDLVRTDGWEISNADVTVLAEAPKLAPHVPTMRARLAEAMGIPVSDVSVKGTTVERMGSIGRREGIGAMAVATLVRA